VNLPEEEMTEVEAPKKTTKSDILKVEKRVIDLELVIAELKESLKVIDVKAISDLKQKIEDLEDLVWVQDAGMIELKKILDSMQSKIAELTVPPELQEKISSIESSTYCSRNGKLAHQIDGIGR